jgi:hypothetical protein
MFNQTRFRTTKGKNTAHAFSCGYVETYRDGATTITLQKENGCFMVKGFVASEHVIVASSKLRLARKMFTLFCRLGSPNSRKRYAVRRVGVDAYYDTGWNDFITVLQGLKLANKPSQAERIATYKQIANNCRQTARGEENIAYYDGFLASVAAHVKTGELTKREQPTLDRTSPQ